MTHSGKDGVIMSKCPKCKDGYLVSREWVDYYNQKAAGLKPEIPKVPELMKCDQCSGPSIPNPLGEVTLSTIKGVLSSELACFSERLGQFPTTVKNIFVNELGDIKDKVNLLERRIEALFAYIVKNSKAKSEPTPRPKTSRKRK